MTQINKKNTLIVMCNGPSLGAIDFSLLEGFDTFGLNSAYRYYQENDWWPTYFGCFDFVVTRSHMKEFKALCEGDNPIKRFFFLLEFTDSPRFTLIENLIPFQTSNKWNNSEEDFKNFNDSGNSGSNACQVGACLGYKKIILLGADCNYVERVAGSEVVGNGIYQIQEDPEDNPNYWFKGYQKKGDVYCSPSREHHQRMGWHTLASRSKENGLDIVNCSPQTTLKCFRDSTLKKELGL